MTAIRKILNRVFSGHLLKSSSIVSFKLAYNNFLKDVKVKLMPVCALGIGAIFIKLHHRNISNGNKNRLCKVQDYQTIELLTLYATNSYATIGFKIYGSIHSSQNEQLKTSIAYE